MAGSINKVILVGNVGQDPQIRTMNNGQKVASFSLATSDRWRDRTSGEQKEQTELFEDLPVAQRLGDALITFLFRVLPAEIPHIEP